MKSLKCNLLCIVALFFLSCAVRCCVAEGIKGDKSTNECSSQDNNNKCSQTESTMKRLPGIFICHGGGPVPLLPRQQQIEFGADHTELIATWKQHAEEITTLNDGKPPRAVLLVSAHFQTKVPTVGSAAKPEMIYDYGGFPPETYTIKYPAPGDVEISKRAHELLQVEFAQDGGAVADPTRGFDHGVFIPMMIMFPKANVPVIPVSVLRSEDPATHLRIGKALSPLLDEGGIWLVASGSTTHNFGYLGSHRPQVGMDFNNKLQSVLCADDGTSWDSRAKEVSNFLRWDKAIEAQQKGAAEHFVPLFVALGAAMAEKSKYKLVDRARVGWRGLMMNAVQDHYWFGDVLNN